MTASTETTLRHAKPLAACASLQASALALAAVTTLAVLSSLTGLADGYRTELLLAQAHAASQPVAAAVTRKAPRG